MGRKSYLESDPIAYGEDTVLGSGRDGIGGGYWQAGTSVVEPRSIRLREAALVNASAALFCRPSHSD